MSAIERQSGEALFFDAHAHFDDERFEEDRASLIEALPSARVVGVVNAGADIASSEASVALARQYAPIYATVGVHPHEAQHMREGDLARLSAWCGEEKVVAIGEIGLDYHYDYSPRDVQKARFDEQLALAARLHMPVVIHTREAMADTLDMLWPYRGILRVMMHSFSGSWETAKTCLDRGYMLSLGGPVTFKNAHKACDVARRIPLDNLLVETDAPYLTPEPHRGERNWSGYVAFVCRRIADLREVPLARVAEATLHNANAFFGLE